MATTKPEEGFRDVVWSEVLLPITANTCLLSVYILELQRRGITTAIASKNVSWNMKGLSLCGVHDVELHSIRRNHGPTSSQSYMQVGSVCTDREVLCWLRLQSRSLLSTWRSVFVPGAVCTWLKSGISRLIAVLDVPQI